MSALRPCEACGGGEMWLVEQVLERGWGSWALLGYADFRAPTSAAVCCACGHVAWRTQPATDVTERWRETRRIVDERLRCRDCFGSSHVLVARMHEAARDADVELAVVRRGVAAKGGRFATVVCDQCGRAEWFACDVSSFDGEPCDGACLRCQRRAQRRLKPFREEDGKPLPVAVVGGRAHGEFELRWCDECGLCDWRAHGIAKLAAERKQIVDARERVPVAGGPYR